MRKCYEIEIFLVFIFTAQSECQKLIFFRFIAIPLQLKNYAKKDENHFALNTKQISELGFNNMKLMIIAVTAMQFMRSL